MRNGILPRLLLLGYPGQLVLMYYFVCFQPNSLTATPSLFSSGDKDPWGQVSSVPTPVSVHYKLSETLDINLITNFEHLPFIVTSI
jgi:hypothetical protein